MPKFVPVDSDLKEKSPSQTFLQRTTATEPASPHSKTVQWQSPPVKAQLKSPPARNRPSSLQLGNSNFALGVSKKASSMAIKQQHILRKGANSNFEEILEEDSPREPAVGIDEIVRDQASRYASEHRANQRKIKKFTRAQALLRQQASGIMVDEHS